MAGTRRLYPLQPKMLRRPPPPRVPSSNPLACNLCNYVFTTKSNLRRHLNKKKKSCTLDTFYPPPGYSIADPNWDRVVVKKRGLDPEEILARQRARNTAYRWRTR
jgi:Zinc finger, C2H2 type